MASSVFARITGVSGYLPPKVVTNDDLSKMVDTTDEWIFGRTGIRQRHIASEGEATSDMVFKCVDELLRSKNVSASEVDMLIVATTTPDFTFPSVASIVQGRLGLGVDGNAPSFDISAACCGFVYGLSIADAMIRSGQRKKIILVGADKMSSLVDWKERSTCVLFGDGAGAVMIEQSSDEGIIGVDIFSDGVLADLLKTDNGVSTGGVSGNVVMNGAEVFKNAVTKMSQCTLQALAKRNLSIKDVDLIIPHQANKRIIDATIERLGASHDKVVISVDQHANTSAASIPLAMFNAKREGRLKNGSLILMHAVGAGLTWGCCLVKY